MESKVRLNKGQRTKVFPIILIKRTKDKEVNNHLMAQSHLMWIESQHKLYITKKNAPQIEQNIGKFKMLFSEFFTENSLFYFAWKKFPKI